jgi:hypothetical protein
MTATVSRVAPLQPPHPPELQQVLAAIMPPGTPPLALFYEWGVHPPEPHAASFPGPR